MSQRTSGIFSLLSSSFIYDLAQNLLGAQRSRKKFVEKYLQDIDAARMLDIGCGTADILSFLPEDLDYTGCDMSEKYIEAAINRYGSRAKFYAKSVTDEFLDEGERFDVVLASGLLHHLDDIDVISLLESVKLILAEGGVFVTIDPCYVQNQSWVSKTLISKDRGQNVRHIDQYLSLARRVFSNSSVYHENHLLRIPYDHAVMICK